MKISSQKNCKLTVNSVLKQHHHSQHVLGKGALNVWQRAMHAILTRGTPDTAQTPLVLRLFLEAHPDARAGGQHNLFG